MRAEKNKDSRAGQRFDGDDDKRRKGEKDDRKCVWADNECNLHLDDIRLCGHLECKYTSSDYRPVVRCVWRDFAKLSFEQRRTLT